MERDQTGCLLKAEAIKKSFKMGRGLSGHSAVQAVDGVSFNIEHGSVFSLVGESGCGKSTVARIILKLLEQDSGSVYFKGIKTSELDKEGVKQFRRSVQMIFQDPFASLNPRISIGAALAEPCKIHKMEQGGTRDAVAAILEKVGLGAEAMQRYPHEFSGGQRQRICIARALMVSPELIVADEPLSALDVSIQAQIINLLKGLMAESGFSLMLISHDLNVVRYLSDITAVMYMGRIVETGSPDSLFSSPMHPYTQLLLDSAPKMHSGSKGRLKASGAMNITTAQHRSEGCAFYPRCSRKMDQCKNVKPELSARDSRHVACHLYN